MPSRSESHGNGDNGVRWAIVATGGKQYRVHVGDVLNVERSLFRSMAAENDANGRRLISFTHLLAVCTDRGNVLTNDTLSDAFIEAELVDEFRGTKVTVFKKRRRHNYRRKQGHRQHLQRVRILSINLEDAPEDTGSIGVDKAKPVIVTTGPRTAHEDLVDTINVLRDEGVDTALLPLLRRIAVTDWHEKPEWARNEVLFALEWHLNAPRMEVRALAAQALDRVLQHETPKAHRSWHAISETVRDYLTQRSKPIIEFSIMRWNSMEACGPDTFTARVRVRKSIKLPQGESVDLAALAEQSRNAEIEVKGLGVVLKDQRRVRAKDLHDRIAAETAVSFRSRPADQNIAVVDVLLAGQRLDRRFLDLSNERVTRHDPLAE